MQGTGRTLQGIDLGGGRGAVNWELRKMKLLQQEWVIEGKAGT
jgi:hypothetical protein